MRIVRYIAIIFILIICIDQKSFSLNMVSGDSCRIKQQAEPVKRVKFIWKNFSYFMPKFNSFFDSRISDAASKTAWDDLSTALIENEDINKYNQLKSLVENYKDSSKKYYKLIKIIDSKIIYLNKFSVIKEKLHTYFENINHPKRVSVVNEFRNDIIPQLDPAMRNSSCINSLIAKWKNDTDGNINMQNIDSIDEISNFYNWLKYENIVIDNKSARQVRGNNILFQIWKDCRSEKEHLYEIESRKVFFDIDGNSYNLQNQDHSNQIYACLNDGTYVKPIIDGDYIYNLTLDGELYIQKDRGESGGHITITQNFVLISAGMIDFRNGKIIKIDNNSGHFKPSDHNTVIATVELIKKYGRNIFSEDAIISDYMNNKIFTVEEIYEMRN